MLNKIWFFLLLVGILYGLAKGAVNSATGRADTRQGGAEEEQPTAASRGLITVGRDLNAAVLDAAKLSVEICIGLIGIMALWLGLLRIAQDAGLVDALAWLMRPIIRWLFPDVPDGHPAQGAMLMNFAANLLGLDNAATPLGLKAMRELQTLNPSTDTATNAMAMFMVINTSSITLIPFTIIGYRATAGSKDPAGPLAGMLVSTALSTVIAIILARWLSRWPAYAATNPAPRDATRPPSGEE